MMYFLNLMNLVAELKCCLKNVELITLISLIYNTIIKNRSNICYPLPHCKWPCPRIAFRSVLLSVRISSFKMTIKAHRTKVLFLKHQLDTKLLYLTLCMLSGVFFCPSLKKKTCFVWLIWILIFCLHRSSKFLKNSPLAGIQS